MIDDALALAGESRISIAPPTRAGLQAYLRTINRLPLLSAESEVRLARQFRDEGDLAAARQLVMSYLRLVPPVARGYAGYGLPSEDLVQEGNVGLMKAVRRFDPERGVRLASFAIHWIKAEIHEFILRNCKLLRVATTKPQRKLFFKLRSMRSTAGPLGQEEIARIAQVLEVKPKDVAEMEIRLSSRELSFDPEGDAEGLRLDHFPDSTYEPSRSLEAEEGRRLNAQGISTALAALDARSRRVIETRWLCEEGKRKTLQELGDELGISLERVRQIESSAMKKMRAALAAMPELR